MKIHQLMPSKQQETLDFTGKYYNPEVGRCTTHTHTHMHTHNMNTNRNDPENAVLQGNSTNFAETAETGVQ